VIDPADSPADQEGADAPLQRPGIRRRAETTIRHLLSIQIVRFGLIGVVNTAFGYGLFIALQLTLGTVTHYLVVLVVSTVIAIVQAYILQRWLVFRHKGNWWAGLARFTTVYFGAFLFNLAALPLLVEIAHLPVIPAQGIAIAVQALGTYTAHKLFTFRSGPANPDHGSTDAKSSDPGSGSDSGSANLRVVSLATGEVLS
jgi:putative flippase GtrA